MSIEISMRINTEDSFCWKIFMCFPYYYSCWNVIRIFLTVFFGGILLRWVARSYLLFFYRWQSPHEKWTSLDWCVTAVVFRVPDLAFPSLSSVGDAILLNFCDDFIWVGEFCCRDWLGISSIIFFPTPLSLSLEFFFSSNSTFCFLFLYPAFSC